MQYNRDFFEKIKENSKHFPVIILTGARQTGKTTLLKELFPKINYVSLDLPSLAAQAEDNPEEFLKKFTPPVIIDEVQYAPKIFRYIKKVVDENRNLMGQFFLTGSQKFLLMKEVSDSLAGRVAWLELDPLSYKEIKQNITFPPTIANLAKIITRGQFPELWRQESMDKDIFYSSYLATYLERDVREILNVTSLRDFERFIRILAARSGQLLNKSDVAKDVGVSVKAIGDWISVLEASNQIVLLEPYYKNISKRIVKSPKIYFCDSGLLCYLLRVNESNFTESPFLGYIWETFVFSELRKNNRIAKNGFNLFYYRDQRAKEVDFFLEQGGFITLIECKWKPFPNKKDAKVINLLSSEINNSNGLLKTKKHFVICSTEANFKITDEVEAINIDFDLSAKLFNS